MYRHSNHSENKDLNRADWRKGHIILDEDLLLLLKSNTD